MNANAESASGAPSIRTQVGPLSENREPALAAVVASSARYVPGNPASDASMAHAASALARPPPVNVWTLTKATRPGVGAGAVTGTACEAPKQYSRIGAAQSFPAWSDVQTSVVPDAKPW